MHPCTILGTYLIQLDVHALSAEELCGLKGEDSRVEKCILSSVGGERETTLTCGMEEGHAPFPAKRDLVCH